MSKLGLLLLVVFVGYSESFNPLFRQGKAKQCPADDDEAWTYRGRKGPKYWGETYPLCNGERQSPINIDTAQAESDENLALLQLVNYETPVSSAKIENNGHTIQVTPQDDAARSITIDGVQYNLAQLHFHWGRTPARGSEHTIDRKAYSMEMHLVHTSSEGEIAVVGIFFQEGPDQNDELQNIVSELSNVMYKDTETQMSSELNLNNLLPNNPIPYYRYDGSLTTPGCAEGVTWSVVPMAMRVGTQQMAEFRKVYSAVQEDAKRGCRQSGNFRPVQPLNNRVVYKSNLNIP